MNSEYIDTSTLAQRTGIAASTWNKRRMSGDTPAYIKVGARCIYRWSEVVAWLDAHQKRCTSNAA